MCFISWRVHALLQSTFYFYKFKLYKVCEIFPFFFTLDVMDSINFTLFSDQKKNAVIFCED